MVHNNWAVYGLYIAVLGSGLAMVSAQRAYLDRKADYDVTEQRYVVYSIVSKVAFAAFLILGFKK
jgi:hypothetical protein